jgi:hypothetical protein
VIYEEEDILEDKQKDAFYEEGVNEDGTAH